MDGQQIAVSYLAKTLEYATRHGIDLNDSLGRAGLSLADLASGVGHVSFETYADVVTSVMLAMDDEGLGHYARRIPVGVWSMMCYAATNSLTLREALLRYCRFFSLLDVGIAPSLLISAKCAKVRLVQTPIGLELNRFISERALLHCHRFSNWLVQRDIPLVCVSFQHAPPASAPYRSMFSTQDVRFGQPFNELVFDASLLASTVERDGQALKDFLRRPVLNLLTMRSELKSWSSLVRREINRSLHGAPTQSEIAHRLCMHPQALRRRLALEGTTFKRLVDEERKRHALHLLQLPRETVEQVAHSTGFSDTSAFVRAFRRWTGSTPHEYRRAGLELAVSRQPPVRTA